MADVILSITPIRHARKSRHCYWCTTLIEMHEPAVRIVGIWENHFSTFHVHPECEDAWRNDPCNTDGEGCIYEHARGKRCDESDVEPHVRYYQPRLV